MRIRTELRAVAAILLAILSGFWTFSMADSSDLWKEASGGPAIFQSPRFAATQFQTYHLNLQTIAGALGRVPLTASVSSEYPLQRSLWQQGA